MRGGGGALGWTETDGERGEGRGKELAFTQQRGGNWNEVQGGPKREDTRKIAIHTVCIRHK